MSNGDSTMERPKTTLHVSVLAKEFHRLVREALGRDELASIDERNNTVGYAEACCATHEFVDTNMVMDEAFTNVMGRSLIGEHGVDDDDLLLWNTAWGLAKCNGFSVDWDDRPRAG